MNERPLRQQSKLSETQEKTKSVQKAVKWTQLKMDFFKLFAKVSYSDSLQPLMSLHQAVKA